MLSFIQQINEIVYIQAILPTAAYISNKSGANGVQQSLTPRQRFPTHTNKLMLRRNTY